MLIRIVAYRLSKKQVFVYYFQENKQAKVFLLVLRAGVVLLSTLLFARILNPHKNGWPIRKTNKRCGYFTPHLVKFSI